MTAAAARHAVDLNADLGEGTGDDASMLALVTSASIACGGHAGDDASMRVTTRLAIANLVRIGAHPSYEDREHFGRRPLEVAPHVLRVQLTSQVRALASHAEASGGRVGYLKPHGALYNTAMADDGVASVILDVADTALATPLPVMCLPGSRVQAIALQRARPVITEGFADREMRAGRLVPRSEPGAVLTEPDQVAGRALELSQSVDSICVHGDTPGAIQLAMAARAALIGAGVTLGQHNPLAP